MQEIIIETAIKTFVEELVKESFALFGTTSNEVVQFYNKGLRTYFSKQKDKYSHIKTLLQGNTPVYLYDIYFPINIQKDYKEISKSSASNLFEDTNFITIIGNAGSGKSTLVKHLFLNSIIEKYAIPILIELRYLNDYQEDIEKYISEIIFENQLSQNTSILERLLKNGKFVFFLDGFDELAGNIRENTIKQLGSFINKYDKNKFILTSRPYANIEFLPLFHNCFIQSLKKAEIRMFIELQLKREKELAQKIVESIENNPEKYISSFLSNPLLLSLYVLTFQSSSDVPNKKYIFYRRVIQSLFSEHDSKSKLGFVRERVSKLSQEKIEDVLKRFSFLTYFEKKFDFDLDYALSQLEKIKSKIQDDAFDSQSLIDDLKLAVALWIEDGNKIKFAHKSLQEYFAALFIKDLTESQKAFIYSKVIDSLSTMSEVDNFLSLCNEMDEIEYTRLFLLPSIQKAIENFTSANLDNDLISRVVKQTYSSLAVTESGQPYHYWSYYPLRKIREIDSVLERLYRFLSDRMDGIAIGNEVQVTGWSGGHYEWTGNVEESVWYLDLNPVPDEIIQHLKNKGILDVLRDTVNELLKMKESKEKFVRNSEKANDELIDMI